MRYDKQPCQIVSVGGLAWTNGSERRGRGHTLLGRPGTAIINLLGERKEKRQW